MNSKTAWKKIFEEDIIFKTHKEKLEKIFDVEKTANYYASLQTQDGYFFLPSPTLQNTYFFCGILHSLDRLPSSKTIEFVRCCQVGDMGFSELPGEIPRTDMTYLALQIFDWFGIPLNNSDRLAEYFQTFQNEDGGFGSLSGGRSTLKNTVDTVGILSLLNSKPKNTHSVISWLKSNIKLLNPIDFYLYIESLTNLNYKFSNLEIEGLKIKIYYFLNSKSLPFQDIHFCLRSLILLKDDIKKFKFVTDEIKRRIGIEYPSIPNLFYISQIFGFFGKVNELNLSSDYLKRFESEQGGFFSFDVYTIKNNFVYQSLFLLGAKDKIDEQKFVEWLNKISNYDGWGGRPYNKTFHAYTTASLISLKLRNSDIKDKENILKRTYRDVNHVLNYPTYNPFFVLRTIQNIFEQWMLLEEEPVKIEELIKKIFEYHNEDGGFGGKHSYIYATFWAVRSLYLADKFLSYKGIDHEQWIQKIKERTSNWIISCQNEDGGFGPMPKQSSNMQMTFHSLYSLWMLKEKAKNINSAIKWIVEHQHNNGGFSGSLSTASEMLHSLYAIGSLVILHKMKA